MKKTDKIVGGKMGSYLLPPNHPGYTFEVATDTNKMRENWGIMSLEYAAFVCEYVHPDIKNEAKRLIDEWSINKLPIDSKDVQKWINECVAHMGVSANKYIKKYYPEYKGILI